MGPPQVAETGESHVCAQCLPRHSGRSGVLLLQSRRPGFPWIEQLAHSHSWQTFPRHTHMVGHGWNCSESQTLRCSRPTEQATTG